MVHIRRTSTTNFFNVRKPGEGLVDRKMTRSVSSLTNPASSTVSRVTKADPVSISLDDICRVVERERQTWSARSRQQAVTKAQNDVTQFHPQPRSRPNTSASRYLHAVRHETMTPKSIRSEPLPSRVSSRQDVDLMDEIEYPINMISSPSPMACEVIGPQSCHDCHKNFRRGVDKQKAESLFKTLRITNGNLTTATVLKKYLPHLSYDEIQDKIARGEVAKNFLPKNPMLPESDDGFDDEFKERQKHVMVVDIHKSTDNNKTYRERRKALSELYFVNIRDLNSKITTGQVDKSIGFTIKDKKSEYYRRQLEASASSMFPAFVSPKKVTLVKEPAYHTYFDPPLLPKANQLPEPSFFAGSDFDYKLPDRLPDDIVFHQNKREPTTAQEASASDVEELEYEQEKTVEVFQ